jgi:hypothetical protein
MSRQWKETSCVTKIGLGTLSSLYRGRYLCLSRSYPAYQKQKMKSTVIKSKRRKHTMGHIDWIGFHNWTCSKLYHELTGLYCPRICVYPLTFNKIRSPSSVVIPSLLKQDIWRWYDLKVWTAVICGTFNIFTKLNKVNIRRKKGYKSCSNAKQILCEKVYFCW